MAKKIKIPRTENGVEDSKNIIAALALEFPHQMRASFAIEDHLPTLRRLFGLESKAVASRQLFTYTVEDDQRWDFYSPHLFFRTEADLVWLKFHEDEFK